MESGQTLDDKARIEIMQVVNEFKDRPKEEWTEENIQAFCEKEKIERVISPGYLEDYAYQAKMDEIMARILPEVIELFAENLRWTPIFSLQVAHQEAKVADEKIVAGVVKLLEREGVEYDFAESMVHNFGIVFTKLFETAERVTKKRATRVFEALARKEFGNDLMTMKNVGEYSEQNFESEKNRYE